MNGACWPKVGVLIMCVYVCDGTPQDSVSNLGNSCLQTHRHTHTQKKMHAPTQANTNKVNANPPLLEDLTDGVTDGKMFHNNRNVSWRKPVPR